MNALPASSNVTVIPPKSDNLHEAIETLHSSQITGDYRYSALAIAGSLISEVGHLFPQHMILIYLTTSYKRRQVWNAYIASMFANPENPQPITNADAVRAKLLNTGSKQLLQESYGAIPKGFQNSLERLGLEGRAPHIYLLLHKFMSSSDDLRKSLSYTSKIEAVVIETLAALPEPLQNFELAKSFRGPKDIKTLTFVIDTLARGDGAKYSEICSAVVQAAKRGHSVSAVLKRKYYLTKFPEPPVPDNSQCRHIADAEELKKAALQFKSCLKQFVPEAIRGEYVYYRWYVDGRPSAAISLRQDYPNGWRIEEVRGKDNLFLDDENELPIIQYFENHGVYKMASMEGMLRELGCLGVLNHGRRRDAVDQIEDVIDELLENDPV